MSEDGETPAREREEPNDVGLPCGRCGRPSTVLVLAPPYVYLCGECLDSEPHQS